MMTARQEVEALTRNLLAEKRSQLNDKHRAFFDNIFDQSPWKSWDKIPASMGNGRNPLLEAIDLINRTLARAEYSQRDSR